MKHQPGKKEQAINERRSTPKTGSVGKYYTIYAYGTIETVSDFHGLLHFMTVQTRGRENEALSKILQEANTGKAWKILSNFSRGEANRKVHFLGRKGIRAYIVVNDRNRHTPTEPFGLSPVVIAYIKIVHPEIRIG